MAVDDGSAAAHSARARVCSAAWVSVAEWTAAAGGGWVCQRQHAAAAAHSATTCTCWAQAQQQPPPCSPPPNYSPPSQVPPPTRDTIPCRYHATHLPLHDTTGMYHPHDAHTRPIAHRCTIPCRSPARATHPRAGERPGAGRAPGLLVLHGRPARRHQAAERALVSCGRAVRAAPAAASPWLATARLLPAPDASHSHPNQAHAQPAPQPQKPPAPTSQHNYTPHTRPALSAWLCCPACSLLATASSPPFPSPTAQPGQAQRARAVSLIRLALAPSYGKLDAPASPTATTHRTLPGSSVLGPSVCCLPNTLQVRDRQGPGHERGGGVAHLLRGRQAAARLRVRAVQLGGARAGAAGGAAAAGGWAAAGCLVGWLPGRLAALLMMLDGGLLPAAWAAGCGLWPGAGGGGLPAVQRGCGVLAAASPRAARGPSGLSGCCLGAAAAGCPAGATLPESRPSRRHSAG
jgi:hypothetical protein